VAEPGKHWARGPGVAPRAVEGLSLLHGIV